MSGLSGPAGAARPVDPPVAAGPDRPLPAVAHVVETWLGLTETFIHEYLAAFRRIRPVVIARRLQNVEQFPLPSGAALIQSPPLRFTPAWAFWAVRRRARGGAPHLESVLRANDVRLLHAHFGPTACDLLEARRRARLPLVTSFYGYDVSITEVVERMREPYRRLFDAGSAFLVEGGAMKRRLEALGCPSSRIRIQRIAIDPMRYRFRTREDPGTGPIQVLQCGRMVPKKGFDITLRAFAEVLRHDRRVRLRLMGDGPERPALEALVRELGLQDHVTMLGARPRAQFLEELDAAHIYVQPSRTAPDGDTEGGAPTTLLEAQATGVPVVSTRHADIPEIVREDDSALLAGEGDPGSLAAALAQLVDAPVRWPSMGRAGRAHVEAQHDVRRLAVELEILYATVAETGRPDMAPQPR